MYTLANLLLFLAYVGIVAGAVPLTLYVITPRVIRRTRKARYRRTP